MIAHRKLVLQLVGAVLLAFVASMVFTWMLHTRMTAREAYSLIDSSFRDVEKAIRERIDRRMIRQAMLVRDRLDQMRLQPWWGDPDESSRRLRALADELRVDEICVADSSGMLTHSARREEVGALNFRTVKGQAGAFAPLLDREMEIVQPLMPNTLRGEMVKYVGVWLPEGGFVQVGANAVSLRRLSRTAVTGVTHDWHVNGDDGNIVVTTALGTVISHSDPDYEGSQWTEPVDDECYWKKRVIEQERELCAAANKEIDRVDKLVGEYVAAKAQAEEEARKAEEAKRAAELAEAQRIAEAEAALTGREIAVHVPVADAEPQKKAPIVHGVTARTVWTFDIVDPDAVPRAYCVPDEKAIRAYMDAAKESGASIESLSIPGVAFRKEIRV